MKSSEFAAEEIWLQSFVSYQGDICFEIDAQLSMARHNVTIPEIYHVLRNGSVIYSERENVGSKIIVTGSNCDEEEIYVHAEMVSEMMHVSVIRVSKPKVKE